MLHRNATIICNFTAKPQATIVWLLNGEKLNETIGKFEMYTTIVNCNLTDHPSKCVQSSTLKIIDFVPVDSGTYSCNVHNVAGNDSQPASLMYNGMSIML